MNLIWNKKSNTNTSGDITKLQELEQFNFKFIDSLSKVVEPFIDKLKKLHGSKTPLNASEKEGLKSLINLLKMYSSKESAMATSLKSYATIINDIHHELAIVMKITNDAENEKIQELYTSCEALKADLIKLENEFEYEEKKLTA